MRSERGRNRSTFAVVAVLMGLLVGLLPAGGARAAGVAVPVATTDHPCPAAIALSDYQEPGGRLLHVVTPTCPLGPLEPDGAGSPRLLDVPFTTGYVQPNQNAGAGRPQVDPPGARIILPAGYGADPARRYPVLYLLHGAGDDYRSWTGADVDGTAEKGSAYSDVLADAAADSGLIVVMPSGGRIGFYTDWYGATVANGRPMYASFHLKQLIPWVDANFRTRADRDGRAVAGLSMGGYGALMYAKKNPALFGTVAAFSPLADVEDTGYGPFLRVTAGRVMQAALATSGSGDPETVLGPTFDALTGIGSGPNWRARNPMRDPHEYAGLDLTIFTGANDVTAPRSSRRRCEIRQFSLGVAIGEAVLESAVCVASERLDRTVRSSGAVPASSYWYQEFPGRLHDYQAWDEYLTDWLPRLMAQVQPGGSTGVSSG